MTGIIGHSERNEMQSKNLKVDVSTALNMTELRSDILLFPAGVDSPENGGNVCLQTKGARRANGVCQQG